MRLSRLARIAIVALAGGVLATPVTAADKVNFALNWIPYGLHFGPFMAEAQGFYEESGIDIEISRGYGSGDTTKRVGTGANNFGMADASSIIVGRARDLPVKMVAMVLDKASDAIYYVKGKGIETVEDLPGRTLGATAGEASLNMMPAFGEGAGIDASKIEVVNMTPPSKVPSLVSGQVDSIVTFTTEEPSVMGAGVKAGVEIGRFMFADYGVDRYSVAMLTSEDMIENNPGLVKRVVEATMRGYAWARDNPEKAADIFEERFPESSRELMLAQFKIALQHMITPLSKEHGLGYIDEEKMAQTIELIESYSNFEEKLDPKNVYTMDYLPKIPAESM